LALALTVLLAGCVVARPLPPATVGRSGAPVGPYRPAPRGYDGPYAQRAPRPPATQQGGLEGRLRALGEQFDGRVGIAVEDVDSGWTTAWDGGSLYPQQSVSKLCTAIALFDAVDQGQVRLSDRVEVRREDMSVFHQPIQAYLNNGVLITTLGDLAAGALVESDNAADDILIARLGGSGVVQAAVDARGLRGVRCGPPIHILEARIAGLEWRPEYSFGQAFWTARGGVDPNVRSDRLRAYLADPQDGATPLAITHLLSRLYRGELLSSASTERMLSLLGQTRTGPLRLPAGLGPGWRIAHKTGTGQDLGDLSTGNNDVGLMTAPDGRTYAVAVMIAATRRPVPERQRLMAEVARAVVAAHDGQGGGRPSAGRQAYSGAGYGGAAARAPTGGYDNPYDGGEAYAPRPGASYDDQGYTGSADPD
jgi:beta-lactamase class A